MVQVTYGQLYLFTECMFLRKYRWLVWSQIQVLLRLYPNCVLLEDFNQLEFSEDKLGGLSVIKVGIILSTRD